MNEQTRIFLCEDDQSLGGLLRDFFESKQYNTVLFYDGQEAIDNFKANKYDLCILDVMMPHVDGFKVAEHIRTADDKVPIIFLTAKTMKEDVLRGFEVGADDYIRKPFSLDELLVRVEVILRRVKGSETKVKPFYQIGKYLFDTQSQLLQFEGEEPINLTTKESALLSLLATYANQTLERSYALQKIWENDNYFSARSMDVYITKLRKLLKRDPSIEIKNIHGKGYRLNIREDSPIDSENIQKL